MAFSAETFGSADDLVSRLASESLLAQPGRDDGLIPAFSLLGDLALLLAAAPAIAAPVEGIRHQLEVRLDGAQPFDAPTHSALCRLVDWLPKALEAARLDRPLPPFAEQAAAPPEAAGPAEAPGAPVPADELLDLHLEENRELLIEFHAEALDHLQQIEAALLALEQRPEDPEALNAIFRSFHTIKGVAGFLHLKPMHTLAHEVESLLDLVRHQKLRLNSEIVTQVLQSRDALQSLVGQITAALEHGRLPDRVIPVAGLIAAVKRCTAAAGPAAAAPPASPVVPLAFPAADPAPAATGPATPAATGPAMRIGSATTVRVNTEKLDTLMDVVGELVIVQSQLLVSSRMAGTDGTGAIQRDLAQLSRITKELQNTAMAVRMIPIKPTFQRMERLARDLARECGRRVAFLVSGGETELDRTVVEEIADPLTHMVRNALDHGLEPPAERVSAGKPDSGTVHLMARHEGSHVIIELSDDGRGIDPGKILAKARGLGLVAAGVELSREEILNLIFLPGFSTAEKVTAVSGRGVGMDVVRRNIERLRGLIEIETEAGRGSTFRIRLPLTMAIIDGLVVTVGGDRFILPSTAVKMALRPPPEALVTVHGTVEVLDLRGRILPLHRLHRQFAIPHAVENPADGIVVVVDVAGKSRALLVDAMLAKQEVVIKNLGGYLQQLPGVAGGAILGDGNIALILDPVSLFQAA
ncbi:MAG: chemotaxis protein CheA [Opitutaceae bacterium]|nr:chemotaxis protein CheA [Opitutaceae bacterium]